LSEKLTDKIVEFVEKTEEVLEKLPTLNEPNTRLKIVDPFIKLLGWDTLSAEVIAEYPLEYGKDQVDYAFVWEEEPLVFLEIKKTSISIGKNEANQLIRYLRLENVPLGALFNGRELKIYTNYEKGKQYLIGEIKLEQFLENWDLIEILSKDLVITGESKKFVERMEKIKKSIKNLEEHREKLVDNIVNLFKDSMGEEIQREMLKREAGVLINIIKTNLEGTSEAGTKIEIRTEEWKENELIELLKTLTIKEKALLRAAAEFHQPKKGDVMNRMNELLQGVGEQIVDKIGFTGVKAGITKKTGREKEYILPSGVDIADYWTNEKKRYVINPRYKDIIKKESEKWF